MTRFHVSTGRVLLIATVAVTMLAAVGCTSDRAPGAAADRTTAATSPIPAASRMSAGLASEAAAPAIEMPAGSIPSLDEEVWVIVRPAPGVVEDDRVRSGSLIARPGDDPQAEPVQLPLVDTGVDATISGYIAAVDVAQRFTNPTSRLLEAIYVFPLPHDAAINGFTMVIGDRRIRGILRDREEAEAAYESAKAQGYTASLLSQERPNVFEQAVANIPPHGTVDIEITYYHTVPYRDGWFEFTVPTTVGPRYNPPDWSDGIGAVASGGVSGQPTDVTYTRPHEDAGTSIDVAVRIDAGVPILEVESPSHVIETAEVNSSSVQVGLGRLEGRANRDFLLRYRLADRTVEVGALTHHDERGGWYTLMLLPPDTTRSRRAPVELVFVLDCSGSMKGASISQMKSAVRRGLRRLDENDTFQVIRFAADAAPLGRDPVRATATNVREAIRFVDGLQARGGTEMATGMRAALGSTGDRERTRYVAFLTDGFIGNESQVLGEMTTRLGDTRVFSFGIGASPNRYLLEQMARQGRGVVAYVGQGLSPETIMDRFMDRVQHPAMTRIQVEAESGTILEQYPRLIPDLFHGRPVLVTGRYRGESPPRFRVRGLVEDKEVAATIEATAVEQPALPVIWARHHISDLIHDYTADPREIPDRVRDVALSYGLVSPFTSYVAVDASQRHDGEMITRPVANDLPEGVSFEGTVGD